MHLLFQGCHTSQSYQLLSAYSKKSQGWSHLILRASPSSLAQKGMWFAQCHTVYQWWSQDSNSIVLTILLNYPILQPLLPWVVTAFIQELSVFEILLSDVLREDGKPELCLFSEESVIPDDDRETLPSNVCSSWTFLDFSGMDCGWIEMEPSFPLLGKQKLLPVCYLGQFLS